MIFISSKYVTIFRIYVVAKLFRLLMLYNIVHFFLIIGFDLICSILLNFLSVYLSKMALDMRNNWLIFQRFVHKLSLGSACICFALRFILLFIYGAVFESLRLLIGIIFFHQPGILLVILRLILVIVSIFLYVKAISN